MAPETVVERRVRQSKEKWEDYRNRYSIFSASIEVMLGRERLLPHFTRFVIFSEHSPPQLSY